MIRSNSSIQTKTRLAKLVAFARDEKGATLMEYVMLAGLIAIVAFTGFKVFGSNVSGRVNGQAAIVADIPNST
jgi:Flp pilus assembly pilin Flp